MIARENDGPEAGPWNILTHVMAMTPGAAPSRINCGFSMSLLSAHGVPMLTDHGFHPMTASSAIGFLGMTAIGGGLGLGLISDRWGRKPVLAAVYLLRVVAFGMLFFVRDPRLLLIVAAIGGGRDVG